MSDSPTLEPRIELISYVLIQLQRLFPIIAILGAAAIWLPDSVSHQLGLDSLRKEYLGWLVSASAVGFLLWSLGWVSAALENYLSIRRIKRRITQRLTTSLPLAKVMLDKAILQCSDAELAVLIFCLKENQDVIFLKKNHPVAVALTMRRLFVPHDSALSNERHDRIVPFFVESSIFRALSEQQYTSGENGTTGVPVIDALLSKVRASQLSVFEDYSNANEQQSGDAQSLN